MTLQLGHLLRLKGQVDAAAQAEPSGLAVLALVDSYKTLREQIVRGLEASGDLQAEFIDSFPDLPAPESPPSNSPYDVHSTAQANTGLALQAQITLARLAGWLDGVIAEQTLDRRMRLEAEEVAKLATKQRPGFTP